MKVAVYTIAKDEEGFVSRWAESAKGADYLLIADTGSTDGTVRMAQELGINVISIGVSPWRFDVARNAALSALPLDMDYCIALDMDEVLQEGWREKLEVLPKSVTRPRYKYTWSWNGDQPGLQYGGDKIHSRHGYVWRHPVHEVLRADRITEIQEWVDLEIHHHPDPTKSRGQYFPLLELAVEEDPLDDRNAFYLGREYTYYQMWDKASATLRRYLELPKAVWKPERAAAMRLLAQAEQENREKWLISAHLEDPGRREALVSLAQYYHDAESWEACKYYATMALDIKSKPLDYLCEDFAWGWLPYDLAAISSYKLGLMDDAKAYGQEALRMNPTDKRLSDNLKYYEQ